MHEKETRKNSKPGVVDEMEYTLFNSKQICSKDVTLFALNPNKCEKES